MIPKHPPGPPMTLRNMPELGVHHRIAFCLNDAVSPLGADLMDLRRLGSILPLKAIQQLPQVNVELVASVRSKLAECGLHIPLRHSNVCALANLRRLGRKFRVHANLPMAPL